MIKKARLDDAREILTVINTSNRELYQSAVPKEHFRDPFLSLDKLLKDFAERIFFAHKSDGEILGVVALQIESEELGNISRLYVLPEHQRRGFGTALVNHLEQEAIKMGLRRLRLHVAEKASWAISFYSELGYDLADKIERPEGFVILMEKQLQCPIC